MLKRVAASSTLLIALLFAAQAQGDEDQAGPTQDLTPVSLQLQRITGEFGGESLRISVGVKNVGSLPVTATSGGIQVAGIVSPQAALYGPNGLGGFNLGAPIAPGASGLFLIDAPVGSLRHCQRVTAWIDTAQSLQSGPTIVFYNDRLALTAIDTNSLRVCVGGIGTRWHRGRLES